MVLLNYSEHVGDEDVAALMENAYTLLIEGNETEGKSKLFDAVEQGKRNDVKLKPCEIMAIVYTDVLLGLEDKLLSLSGFMMESTKYLPSKDKLENYPEISKISKLISAYSTAFYGACGHSIRCGDSND